MLGRKTDTTGEETTPMDTVIKRLLLLAACLLLGACNTMDLSITGQPETVTNAPVRLSDLEMYVRPQQRQHRPLKALMFPMWIKQPTSRSIDLGREYGKVFHSAWVSERLFPTQVYDEKLVFRGAEKAVAEGRKRGADLVILTYTPYFYPGGTMDDTDITIQCEIYETTGGNLLFSMAQAARVEYRRREDWIFFAHRTRLPSDPLAGSIALIAKDMAVPVESWLPPMSERDYGFAATRDEIADGLTGQGTAGLRVTDLADDLSAATVYLKVEFDKDKATIRQEYYAILDELGQALEDPRLKDKPIVLAGHTDSDADAAYNLDLSRRRADAVKDYLVDRFAVDPTLVTTEGYGESRPLVPNTTPENMQINRRVEVRLAD